LLIGITRVRLTTTTRRCLVNNKAPELGAFKLYPMMYVIGEIKFSQEVSPLAEYDGEMMEEFMREMQSFMDLYAITRIDLAIDPYRFMEHKKEIR
jgi:hypothetical protein